MHHQSIILLSMCSALMVYMRHKEEKKLSSLAARVGKQLFLTDFPLTP